MFDIVYLDKKYWVMSQDESESFGPYIYAAEAQEKADELNETNNNQTQESEVLTAKDSDNASRS